MHGWLRGRTSFVSIRSFNIYNGQTLSQSYNLATLTYHSYSEWQLTNELLKLKRYQRLHTSLTLFNKIV